MTWLPRTTLFANKSTHVLAKRPKIAPTTCPYVSQVWHKNTGVQGKQNASIKGADLVLGINACQQVQARAQMQKMRRCTWCIPSWCIPAFLALKMARVPPAWLNYAMQASSSKLCTDCWIGCKRALDYDVAQPIHQKWKLCTNQRASVKYRPVITSIEQHS